MIIADKASVVNIVTVIKRKFNTESNHRMVGSKSSLSLKLRVRNPPHRIEESITEFSVETKNRFQSLRNNPK